DRVAQLVQEEFGAKATRAHYRMGATAAVAGRDTGPGGRRSLMDVKHVFQIHDTIDDKDSQKTRMHFGFRATFVSVLESIGALELVVFREGAEGTPLGKGSVQYITLETGTAKANEDFIAQNGTLHFAEGVTEMTISIPIIDDAACEDDEYFKVKLYDPAAESSCVCAMLHQHHVCEVRIVDDDHIGQLAFATAEANVEEQPGNDKVIVIGVARVGGSRGRITCNYRTEDDSAHHGLDYEEISGTLVFEDGEVHHDLSVTIKPRGRYESKDIFRLILEDPEGGVTFVKHTDGGEDSCICTIMIESDAKSKDRTDKLMQKMRHNWQTQQLARSNWKDQIAEAICLERDEDGSLPGKTAIVMHVITVPWKLLFALIPPVDYCGGWLCFCCSLIAIGMVTAVLGDLASLAGCTIGIPDQITAITLVALGTSLPDTFASKSAAEKDPYADASIGNVTGSNSVNVFLGLGLPWMIGSIYWAGRGAQPEWLEKYADYDSVVGLYPEGGKFVVLGGSLGFSVIVFCICAMVCIAVLVMRRMHPSIRGELGGPRGYQLASAGFFVFLWCVYIGASCWKALSEPTAC
ncbi:unnamed protein product, partial [Polarella glacialis]